MRVPGSYISGKSKELNFDIPGIRIERVDDKEVKSRIMSIAPEGWKRE
ncbi:MAG: hypothetical protein M0Z77_04600 [Thermoplasmatales archaeon]|nr:hypothetical protein [Thermoplasmatales archaeon]